MASAPIGVVVPVAASASALYGNLSAAGGRVAHVHKDEVWINAQESLLMGESKGEVEVRAVATRMRAIASAVDAGRRGCLGGVRTRRGGGRFPDGARNKNELAPVLTRAVAIAGAPIRVRAGDSRDGRGEEHRLWNIRWQALSTRGGRDCVIGAVGDNGHWPQ